MKPYPVDKFEIMDDEMVNTIGIAEVPTQEALKNFNDYLEANELDFYNSLPMAEQLQIRISVNPFRALLEKMDKFL